MSIPLANNIKNVYAGGPERDYHERYEDVPDANECWYDGYTDGKDHPFDDDRNRECKDKGIVFVSNRSFLDIFRHSS